eukprot:gene10378-biopygen5221
MRLLRFKRCKGKRIPSEALRADIRAHFHHIRSVPDAARAAMTLSGKWGVQQLRHTVFLWLLSVFGEE